MFDVSARPADCHTAHGDEGCDMFFLKLVKNITSKYLHNNISMLVKLI